MIGREQPGRIIKIKYTENLAKKAPGIAQQQPCLLQTVTVMGPGVAQIDQLVLVIAHPAVQHSANDPDQKQNGQQLP
jgi:hypothetical protein